MQWYDYVVIVGCIIGFIIILFGSYHESGGRKSGLWGWILIIVLLIIRVSLWIASTIK